MEETIDFKNLVNILKKRMKLLIATALIFTILSAIYTFFIVDPQYEASTQILVNQSQSENEQSSTTDIESSRELINTYNVIITSPAILEPVTQRTNFNGSVGSLRSKTNVSAEAESQVAIVTVTDSDPQTAVELANTIGQTFEQQIPEIMNVDNVSILSEAQLSESSSPVSPQPFLNLLIAFVVGLIISSGWVIVKEFLDKSLKSEEDIEKELNLPILGVVPTIQEVPDDKYGSSAENKKLRSNAH